MLIKSPEQHCRRIARAVVALFLITAGVHAQISDKIGKISSSAAEPGKPVDFKIELLQASTLERIEFAYRQFGVSEFSRIEMSLAGNVATVTIPGTSVIPPFLEYYLLLYYGGTDLPETFPVENPEQAPLRVAIQPGLLEKTQIIIMSPDPGEIVYAEDLLISVSLARYDSGYAFGSIRVQVDKTDLSHGILRYGDLIIVRPENIAVPLLQGSHEARVTLVDKEGRTIDSISWSFSVKDISGDLPQMELAVSPFRYYTSLQLETRQENIGGTTTPFNRATLTANGSYLDYQIRGNLYLTNEEKEYRQPQNRFLIVAESPWLKTGYGDSYQSLPDLIMSGKRLRGFFANLTLGSFNLDIASGTVTRKINSVIGVPFPESELAAEQSKDSTATFQIYDTTGGVRQWVKLIPGTYERNLLVIHPIFGKRTGTHFGLTYLKGKDDLSSIHYGIRPKENAVFGTDLLLSFDRQNIEIMGQAAFSATNHDISKGSFTDEDIDSIYSDSDENDRENIRRWRDYFSGIITINENLVPLNMKNFPTISYEGGIALNYFGNTLRMTYLRHGEAYESFGQTYLRSDVQGFVFSDRLRLIKNQIFISTGYEHMRDNTSGAKPFTIKTNTANISVSYFPIVNFPNVTVSYLYSANRNGADSLYAISDRTNRFLVHIGKDYTYIARHNLYITLGTSVRNDYTIRDMDTRSTTIGIGAISTFEFPLQTTFNVTVNSNKIASSFTESSTITYTVFYANAQYHLLNRRMTLTGSLSPTLGDIERHIVNLGVQYSFWQYLTARTELSLYFNKKLFNNVNTKNDVVWTFSIRADV